MKRFLNLLITIMFVSGLSIVTYSIYQILTENQIVSAKIEEARKVILDQKEMPNQSQKINLKSLEFERGETIGLINIPRLDRELPIIEGTDQEELKMGVGHYIGTSLPLQNDQIVLSGHRETAFRNFDQLEIGDSVILKLSYGTFGYKIYDTDIVEADDLTVIRSTSPKEILTLTTCYPFNYIGDAPQRYIVYAKPAF